MAKKPEASTAWAYQSASTVNTTNKTVSLTGLTSFSHFTLTDNISPLPIRLESFAAAVKASVVGLEWQTGSETGSEQFELQRSYGSQEYSTIASFTPKGNNSRYEFNDLKPLAGTNYYRLRMTDRDGSVTFSTVVTAIIRSTNDVTIYPNPASSQLFINASVAGEIIVIDMYGKVVLARYVNGNNDAINISSLAAGHYIVKYNDFQTRIIKTN